MLRCQPCARTSSHASSLSGHVFFALVFSGSFLQFLLFSRKPHSQGSLLPLNTSCLLSALLVYFLNAGFLFPLFILSSLTCSSADGSWTQKRNTQAETLVATLKPFYPSVSLKLRFLKQNLTAQKHTPGEGQGEVSLVTTTNRKQHHTCQHELTSLLATREMWGGKKLNSFCICVFMCVRVHVGVRDQCQVSSSVTFFSNILHFYIN